LRPTRHLHALSDAELLCTVLAGLLRPGRVHQARPGAEILTLRREDVDLERGALHRPDFKTGPKSVPANLGC
jgi:hypothetical protein